jgi:predicted nucleotidyltransferase
MRITEHEKNVIVEAVKNIDPDAKIWLFGSRTDDSKKGGDIDIAILSKKIKNEVMQKIQVRRFICNNIGEQKIDIVTSSNGKEAFFRLAVNEGVKLN